MNWTFLDVVVVEALQHEQIVRFGGSHGLRERGLLESAVMRAEMKAHYEPDATVATVAASLAWGLIKNHVFIDGNKRIGLVSAVVFLKLNGYVMTASSEEQVAEVLRVATGEASEDEWTAWVARSVAPENR